MPRSPKVVAIAQARMGSTRVPGKVMRELEGIPVLQWTINALNNVDGIDEVYLATSDLSVDDVIELHCRSNSIKCFRGSESDVLDRFYQCAKKAGADIVLRVTCDCPFLDWQVIGQVIKLREMTNADYASNTEPPSYPDGLDVECFTFRALESAWNESTRSTDRDCVTRFIVRNRSRFPAVNLSCPLPGLRKERWVLDTEADWKLCQEIASRICSFAPSYLEILNILDNEPELRELNAGAVRNERFYQALADEQLPPRTFERSKRVFERAIQTIPFGAQTFSKSHIQFPVDAAPLYVSHGDGAYIFDVDGNEYVDLVNALLPVVLGYRDPDVDLAIKSQLDKGISFSLATEMEAELAETLCRLIPSCEMAKFGKSGTDVTTAAVRLARAYTGRDHILVGGYHGWADWSMSPTERNLGIPEDIRKLSHQLPDEGCPLPIHPDKIAAIIIEPNEPHSLNGWRAFSKHHGIVLIFDEIITGFRYDMGGAQKLFDVTPDLSTFGKSMGNGMPINAVVGRKDIMKLFEPAPDRKNIFYSGTFFGETLSIAAALATIKKMEAENVIEHLWTKGAWLEGYIGQAVVNLGLTDIVRLSGEAPRILINFNGRDGATADQIRTFFMREMIQQGVLIINSNNMSFSHKEPELKRISKAYLETFKAIAAALHDGTMRDVRIGNAPAPLRQTA